MAVNDPMSNGTRATQMNQSGQTSASMATNQTSGASSGQTTQSVKDVAGQVASQAQQQAGQVAEQVKQQGKSQLSTQKANAAQSLQGVAQAADQFSQQLRQNNQAPLAGYVSQASGQLRRMASYLNDNDIGDIIDDAEDLARRQPVLFIGGAFLLGALAARFIKSSGQQAQQARSASYGAPSYRGARTGYRGGYQQGYRTGYRPGYQGGAANGRFTSNAGAGGQWSDRPYQRDNGTSLGYYDPGTTGEDEREVRF